MESKKGRKNVAACSRLYVLVTVYMLYYGYDVSPPTRLPTVIEPMGIFGM